MDVRITGLNISPSTKPIPPAKKNNCLKFNDNFLIPKSETRANGIYIPWDKINDGNVYWWLPPIPSPVNVKVSSTIIPKIHEKMMKTIGAISRGTLIFPLKSNLLFAHR